MQKGQLMEGSFTYLKTTVTPDDDHHGYKEKRTSTLRLGSVDHFYGMRFLWAWHFLGNLFELPSLSRHGIGRDESSCSVFPFNSKLILLLPYSIGKSLSPKNTKTIFYIHAPKY